MKSFGSKKFQKSSTGKEVPFWQCFRMGWDGRALLGRPSRIPHKNLKVIFAFGADEYIERLEGKIRECLFFYVKIF
jgi:hypothetical protein